MSMTILGNKKARVGGDAAIEKVRVVQGGLREKTTFLGRGRSAQEPRRKKQRKHMGEQAHHGKPDLFRESGFPSCVGLLPQGLFSAGPVYQESSNASPISNPRADVNKIVSNNASNYFV